MADLATFTWKMSGFDLDCYRLATGSKKTNQQIINKKLYFITARTIYQTTKSDYMSMRAEIGPIGQKIIGQKVRILKGRLSKKTGQRVGNLVRPGKFIGGDLLFAPGRKTDKQGNPVPLLALIIQKRTHGYYFRGATPQAGARAIYEAVKKMWGARARSIAFLKSIWIPARAQLRAAAYGERSPVPESQEIGKATGKALQLGAPKSRAQLAKLEVNPSGFIEATITLKHDKTGRGFRTAQEALGLAFAEEMADWNAFVERNYEPLAREFNASAKR